MEKIKLRGIVGWHFNAKSVEEALKTATSKSSEVSIELNTPGGSIVDGFEVFDLIRSYSKKIDLYTVNISLAASMGSVLMLSAKPENRIANKYSILMIHNPSSIAWGDADAMESSAKALRIFENYASDIYEEETGGKKDKAYFTESMKKETWYSSSEMVDIGFASLVKNFGAEKPYKPEKDENLPDSVMQFANNIYKPANMLFEKNNVANEQDYMLLSTLTDEQLNERLWTKKSLKRWV